MTDAPRSPSIDQLLASMPRLGASDLFLCQDRPPAVRQHGVIRFLNAPATSRDDLMAFLEAWILPSALARFEQTGDLDVGVSLERGRYRLSIGRQMAQLTVVARALPGGELAFDDLALPPVARRLAEETRGIVLVTGATGSGKSTTLAAMIHHINSTRRAHIVTIEDPIEFVHRDRLSRVTQREVGTDTDSFQAALRHVVRQSPDVILVGEMRDVDTMQVALSAALTGHLVFSTLHTIDAAQTLQRILSYFPAHTRAQAALDLSLCLRGILSQRLLPRKDGQGRVVAVESLLGAPAALRLVREQRVDDLADLMKSSADPGLCTFNQSVLRLFQAGTVDYEVGLTAATSPDEFALMAKGMSTGVSSFRTAAGGVGIEGRDLKALLGVARERGASDLHLAVGRPPILRITGSLVPVDDVPLTATEVRMLLFSVLNARQRGVYELERELDFALALEDGQRFRVNAYYQKGDMAMALRAIPSRVPDPETLFIPPHILALADRPHGLLLVVGPTGSGKTTTLACLVDRINHDRSCRIITVEDPIEYVHEGVRATVDQREVYDDTRSFATALKYILRQDPDVILVGEMRDLETIGAAITAAETGHLVLATLHTNDAPQTVDRIIDVFPPHQQPQVRAQLASALIAVVSQRLVPRKDGFGRLPAFEVMVANPAVRTLIREGRMHQALSTMETSRQDGMVTIDFALRELVQKDLITIDEALHLARNAAIVNAARPPEPPPTAAPRVVPVGRPPR